MKGVLPDAQLVEELLAKDDVAVGDVEVGFFVVEEGLAVEVMAPGSEVRHDVYCRLCYYYGVCAKCMTSVIALSEGIFRYSPQLSQNALLFSRDTPCNTITQNLESEQMHHSEELSRCSLTHFQYVDRCCCFEDRSSQI